MKRLLFLLGFISEAYCQLPQANFSVSATQGCAPFTVSFTNQSNNATSYFWDFGNGNTSVLSQPVFSYTNPGTYTVKLVAYNATGSDSIIMTNLVQAVGEPVADFSTSLQTVCANSQAIQFTNNSTGAIQYTWDFGDGDTSNTMNPVHLYQNAGNYTVQLIASNGFCQDIKILTQYIHVLPQPVLNPTVNTNTGCDPSQVFQFASPAGLVSCQWNFGDNTTSSLPNPSHTYAVNGTYDITLTGQNSLGCYDTLSLDNFIYVSPAYQPQIIASGIQGCMPLNLNFHTNQNYTAYSWNAGNGQYSIGSTLNASYVAQGNYLVTLSVTDSLN